MNLKAHYLRVLHGLAESAPVTVVARSAAIRKVLKPIYDGIRPKGTVRVDYRGMSLFVSLADEGIIPILLAGKEYEPFTVSKLREIIRPQMIVFDIGANFGYYTVLASKLVGNRGRVYAFEPERKNIELLKANIAANRCTNVEVIEQALADECGESKLYLDGLNFGNPSLIRANVPDLAGWQSTATMTLDKFVRDKNLEGLVDVAKIDVQGAEGMVLSGSLETLVTSDVKLVVEVWPKGLANAGTDAVRFLSSLFELGYRAELLDESHETLSSDAEDLACRFRAIRARNGFANIYLEKKNPHSAPPANMA